MEIDFNIAICGCISSGKSTFINGLLKFNVNKMSKIKSTLVPIIYI
jgi:septin family protein